MAEAAVTDGGEDVITQCTCKIKKKDYTVVVTKRDIRWQVAGSKGQKDLQVVRIEYVLSAKLRSSTKHETDNDSVRLAYVKQKKKLHLVFCSVLFTSADLQLVSKLHQQINDLIANVQQRPKKLLVLINPVSGRGKGRAEYTQKVAPLFQEAGIETEVIVTEKAHHTEEILLAYDIKSIDGLVLVGGDGLYHEAVNGLIQKLSKEQGLNLDDPDVCLPEMALRIGLIPCGTGNGVAVACYGNYDVTTAALSIAVGHQIKRNVMSVHCGGKLVAYSIVLVGYGTWGDVIHTAESKRDQGRLRYPIAFFQHTFIKPLRRLNLTIQTVAEDKVDDKPSAEVNKVDNTSQESDVNEQNVESQSASKSEVLDHCQGNLKTTTVKENVTGAIIFLIMYPCMQEPDLSQSKMYLNKSPLRRKFLSFLVDFVTSNFDALERKEHIAVLPGHQWTVKLDEPSEVDTENSQLEHIVNIDGEVFKIPQPGYQAKLLTQKMKMFSNLPYATEREKSD